MSTVQLSDAALIGVTDELYDIRSQLRLGWLALANDDWRVEEDTVRVMAVLENAQTRLKAIGARLCERIPEVTLADVGLEAAHG